MVNGFTGTVVREDPERTSGGIIKVVGGKAVEEIGVSGLQPGEFGPRGGIVVGRGVGGSGAGSPVQPGVNVAQQRARAEQARQDQRLAQIEQARVTRIQGAISKIEERVRLGRVSGRELLNLNERVQNLRQSIELGRVGGIEQPFRTGITTRAGPTLQTLLPEEFEQRQIGRERGIPVTAFFNLRTGRQATKKQEQQLSEQRGSELVIGQEDRLRLRDVEFFTPTQVTTQFRRDSVTGALIPIGKPLAKDPKTGKLVPFTDKSLGKFTEQRLSEFFSKGDKFIINNADLIPDAIENVALTKVPFSFTDQLKILFFAPAIVTGAVTKGAKAKQVVVQKAKGKKPTIKATVRSFETEFSKGNVGLINQRLRDLSNVIQGQSDPLKKRIAVDNLQKILKGLSDKKIINNFAIDQATGQFNINLLRTTPKVRPPTITIDISDAVLATGRLAKVGEIISSTSAISETRRKNIQRVQLAREKNRIRIENSKKPLGERLTSADVPAILGGTKQSEFSGLGLFERSESTLLSKLKTLQTKPAITSVMKRSLSLQRFNINQARLNSVSSAVNRLNLQLQRNKLAQQSLTRQIQSPLLKTNQLSKQGQLSKLSTLQRFQQQQLLKLKQIQRNILKGRAGRKVGRGGRFPRRIPPRPPFFAKPKLKPFKARVVTKVEKKFDVFTRKKGVDRKVKSFKTKSKAQTFLRKRLSFTLRASGFIIDRKRGVKVKPIVKSGFRLAKRDPLRLVEKRGRRLDSRREVAKIQEAKRKAPKKTKSRRKK